MGFFFSKRCLKDKIKLILFHLKLIERVGRVQAVFTVPPLSSFVITSRANEEKLPHPQNPVLLINPSCKLPRRCPPPLSPRRLPARLALAPSVFLAGVSGGCRWTFPECYSDDRQDFPPPFYLKLNCWGRCWRVIHHPGRIVAGRENLLQWGGRNQGLAHSFDD